MDRFRLDGKIALVTGAGSGLGRQFSLTLAEAGATVALAARRREKLAETAAMIEEIGGRSFSLDLDVTDALSVTNCLREVESELGVPDILVNNAGIARQGFLTDISESDWDAVLDTNLKGVFLVAQATAKAMIRAEKAAASSTLLRFWAWA
jgi:NAD(P)-dependent dehydrogenase (short-subunit alcohol dehydrogenase family)